MSEWIVPFDGALPEDVCARVITEFEADGRVYPGRAGNVIDPRIKKSIDLDLDESEQWQEITRRLRGSLDDALRAYRLRHPSLNAVARMGCRGFRIHKYTPAGYFDWHIDAGDSAVCARILSCIWYLNTVNGGETMFKNQRVNIEPIRGRLLLFPSSFQYLHRGAPPIGGNKYVVVGFIEHL